MSFETASFLIEAGADPLLPTVNGITAANWVESQIGQTAPGPALDALRAIRSLLQERGLRFPPPNPAETRREMKARGMRVVE